MRTIFVVKEVVGKRMSRSGNHEINIDRHVKEFTSRVWAEKCAAQSIFRFVEEIKVF